MSGKLEANGQANGEKRLPQRAQRSQREATKASSFVFSVLFVASVVAVASLLLCPAPAAAQDMPTSLPGVGDLVKVAQKATSEKTDKGEKASDWSAPVKMALVFGGLALLPSALVMMTSFTRIIIVLGFVRRALTTQNIPPTVALVGLALFLTIFTMAPTFGKMNEQAIQPYLQDTLGLEQAADLGGDILKDFMIRQTRRSDLEFFIGLSGVPQPETAADVPQYVAIPAFAISEFRTGFEMGCLLFIPFLLVDLVISSILLSAGMMMLPPAMISLPFKIILFVLVDGWRLLAETLVGSFQYG